MGGGQMGGMGGFQLGAKRKGEFYDDFGAPKKPYGGGGNDSQFSVVFRGEKIQNCCKILRLDTIY